MQVSMTSLGSRSTCLAAVDSQTAASALGASQLQCCAQTVFNPTSVTFRFEQSTGVKGHTSSPLLTSVVMVTWL